MVFSFCGLTTSKDMNANLHLDPDLLEGKGCLQPIGGCV